MNGVFKADVVVVAAMIDMINSRETDLNTECNAPLLKEGFGVHHILANCAGFPRPIRA